MKLASAEFVDRLSVDYFMWDAYVEGRLSVLASPVRLPRQELNELASLSERFARLLEETVDLVMADRNLLRWYGFPPALVRMIEAERPRPPVVLARYDALRSSRGWQFTEFNTDVPGGVHEGAGMNEIGGGAPGEFRVIPLLAEALCRDSVRPTVAICYASGYAEDLEQCQFIRREIGRLGIPAILCNPENLTWNGRELAVFGRRIDAVYRFFPCEWLEKVDSLDLILAAARSGRLNMINGFASIIAQSKKTMALWHERADLFDADDRALIERHVPKTTIFVASKGDRYRRERERLVVKRQFGRMGEEVLMGCLCANDEWADWLSWPASEAEHWVVQERVDSVPVEVDGERLYGCFGPYVVGGRFAGLYNRFAQDGFIANDALVGAVLGT